MDITCLGERKNFICTSEDCGRRYFEGDGPPPQPVEAEPEDSDEDLEFVEQIATRAAEIALSRNQQPEKLTLLKRLLSR